MLFDEKFFLGIDVGTSSVKAGFVSEKGQSLFQTSEEYPTYYGNDGAVEQDANDWWLATTSCVQALSKMAPEIASKISAISISCQAPTLFGIDEYGNPACRGLIWMDRRAEEICKTELKQHEEYIHSYSYNRIDPYYAISKMVWQKTFAPQDYDKISCYLQINGWIIYKLTEKCTIDVTNANLTQLMNVQTLDWDAGIFERLNLDINKMAPIVSPYEIIGTISAEAASLWGISQDAIVVAGCVDGSAAPLGLGLNRVGDIFEMSGTSSGIGLIMDKPHQCLNLCLMKHPMQDRWFLKGSTSCSGGSLKWYRDQVDCSDDAGIFEEYSKLATESVPGANGVTFLPYLNGERAPLWDSNLRGVCVGFSPSTEKKDIMRAIMEGTAYALRTIWEELPDDVSRSSVIYGTGGGYRSAIWSQIKSSVLNMPISARKDSVDAAILGNCFIAMEAIGCQVPLLSYEEETYYPQAEDTDMYNFAYNRFCKTYNQTKVLFHGEE